MNQMITATGTIESKSWEQTEYANLDGAPVLSAASGCDVYHGDIEGDAEWRGLMVATSDGSGTFESVQRMMCTVGGHSGSFVLRMTGTFDPTGDSRADWTLLPHSGTGELRGISGTGGYRSTGSGSATYTLAYRLPEQ